MFQMNQRDGEHGKPQQTTKPQDGEPRKLGYSKKLHIHATESDQHCHEGRGSEVTTETLQIPQQQLRRLKNSQTLQQPKAAQAAISFGTGEVKADRSSKCRISKRHGTVAVGRISPPTLLGALQVVPLVDALCSWTLGSHALSQIQPGEKQDGSLLQPNASGCCESLCP